MQVKTFEALTVKDALKAIKLEFGANAVILGTKERPVEPGSQTRMIEVTAAAAGSSEASQRQRPQGAFPGRTTPDDQWTDSLQTIESRLLTMGEQTAKRSQVDQIQGSLEELKTILIESMRQTPGSPLHDLPSYLSDIHRQLTIMGVDDVNITKLMKHLKDLPPQANAETSAALVAESEYYRTNAIRWMLKRIRIAPSWTGSSSAPAIHVLAGPTGTGKTAMSVKLAAQLKKSLRAEVLVVSFDENRVGSSEQLRILTKILDLPFVTIGKVSDFKGVMDAHRNAEIVIVDTAGRSPKNAAKISEVQALAKLDLPIETHLVLSSSEKPSQLDRSVRAFAGVGISSLIFTKLDETWSYGDIFNVAAKWDLPLSYFSTGQKIPEDFEKASRERVIERIFGI